MKITRLGLVLWGASLLLAHGQFAATDTLPPGISVEEEASPSPRSETASRIIAMHLKAAGGETALRDLNALQAQATVEENRRTFTATLTFAEPDRFRGDYAGDYMGWNYQHTVAYDGEKAWRQERSPKLRSAVDLTRQETENLRRRGLLFNALIDSEAKGHEFTFQGKTEVFEQPAYLVKAILKSEGEDPLEAFYYFDTKNFFILNIGYKEFHAGREVDVDRHTTRMKKIDGLWQPMAFEFRSDGAVIRRETYREVAINPDLPDDYFSMESADQRLLDRGNTVTR